MFVVTLDKDGSVIDKLSAKDYEAAGELALSKRMPDSAKFIQIWKDEQGQNVVLVQTRQNDGGVFTHCSLSQFKSSLSKTLQRILDEQSLTIYGASQIIGAETDEPLKTIHRRLSEWLRKTPLSWSAIETALNALGYEITISKKL